MSITNKKNSDMTTEDFKKLWGMGKAVEDEFGARVEPNYTKFPEAITGEIKSGVVYGVHFSFREIEKFASEYPICMFSLDTVDGETTIERRKDSHGDHVYLVKMCASEQFPVMEIEYGREYRTLAAGCYIKKVKI